MAELDECGMASSMQGNNHRDSICSFSSGSSMSNSSSTSIKSALGECSHAWKNYLGALNNLCTAGSKLAHSISVLEQCGLTGDKHTTRLFAPENSALQNHPSTYLTSSWSDLARATAVATNTVKSHIMSVMQDFITLSTLEQNSTMCESEQKRIRDHNEQIIMENAQTMANIQHQFCSASYNAFSSLTCCFVCHSPVGFPHEPDCTIIKPKGFIEPRSQTPSPNFGGSFKMDLSRGNSLTDQRAPLLGATSAQLLEQINFGMDQQQGASQQGPSPQHNYRDTVPLQAIFENTRGPLPNPGHLLAMKIPFYRSSKSPLYFPLFPLNGQRRWSEAAACEAYDDNLIDAESPMRRWSMPWEAWKTDPNTVTWYHTRIMPVNTFKTGIHKLHAASNAQEPNWRSSISSQDGLTEAIQLLSCKPSSKPGQGQGVAQQPHPYPPDASNYE